jgi:hypothetical protein
MKRPGIIRPWDYASLGRFVPGRIVTKCPHFLERTINPHFENSQGRIIQGRIVQGRIVMAPH